MLEILAATILIIFSVAGFSAIFFTNFGTLIIFLGALIYAGLTRFSELTVNNILLLTVLYLLGEICEYLLVVVGVKKFGASSRAAAGAVIGGIIGAVLGAGFLGIGILPGTFLGIFLGAFIPEILSKKSLAVSAKAGMGGVAGRISLIFVKLILGTTMLAIIIYRLILS